MTFGSASQSENIFQNKCLDDSFTNESNSLDITLVPSICNKQMKESGSIQIKEETLEVLNICN